MISQYMKGSDIEKSESFNHLDLNRFRKQHKKALQNLQKFKDNIALHAVRTQFNQKKILGKVIFLRYCEKITKLEDTDIKQLARNQTRKTNVSYPLGKRIFNTCLGKEMGGCASQQRNLVSLADAKKKGAHKAKAKSSDFEIAFSGKLEILSQNVDDLISEWYSVNDFFSNKMEIVLEICGIFIKQTTQTSKEAILEKLKSEEKWKCYVEDLVLIIGRAGRELMHVEQRLSEVSQQVEELNDMEMQLLRAQKSKVVYKIEKAKSLGTLHNDLEEWNSVIKMSLGFTYTDLKLRMRSSKKLTYISPIEYSRKGQERSNTISFRTQTRGSSIVPINSNRTTTNYQNTNCPGINTPNQANSSMNFSFQAG